MLRLAGAVPVAHQGWRLAARYAGQRRGVAAGDGAAGACRPAQRRPRSRRHQPEADVPGLDVDIPLRRPVEDWQRHAVEQAIAAERLEGWRPTDEHITDLGRLARHQLTFGDYLAAYRARHPPAVEPSFALGRIFRRTKPYLIPGTNLLRNSFG